MDGELRKTGIKMIGDVPWGTHFCQFYKTKKDLMDTLVPYFKAGLRKNEFCLWVTSGNLSEKEAIKAMRKAMSDFDRYLSGGRMEIVPHTQWYLKRGAFSHRRVFDGWMDKLNQALERGFDGIRVTGDTAWLKKRSLRKWIDYEKNVHQVIGQYRMIAICTYPLFQWGVSEVIDVVHHHQATLIRRNGQWKRIENIVHQQREEVLGESEKRYRLLVDHSLQGIVIAQGIPPRIVFVNPAMTRISGYTFDELTSLSPEGIRSLIHPEDWKTFYERYQAYLEGRSVPSHHEMRGFRKNGTLCWLEFFSTRIEYKGHPAVQTTCVDITERKRGEEALQRNEKEAKRLAREKAIMAEIGRVVSSTNDIEEMYKRFAGEVKKLIPFDRIAINIISSEDKLITYDYAEGVDVKGWRSGDSIPLNGTVAEKIMKKGKSMLIQGKELERLAGKSPLLLSTQKAGLRSMISVPLISKKRVIGILYLRSLKPYAYTKTDLKHAEDISNQIAGAIANAQLFREHQEKEKKIMFQASLLDQVKNAVIATDLDGRIIFWNKFAEKLYQWKGDGVTGKKFAEIMSPEMVKTIKQSGYWEGELIGKRKDGKTFPIFLTHSVIRGTKGKVSGMISVSTDITEVKQAEEALRQNEERLGRIVETIPSGITIMNRNGQITFANAAAERILGLTRDGITQRFYNDAGWNITTVDGNPFPEEELPFPQVMRTGKPVYGVEYAIVHADGTRVIISVNAATIHDAGGDVAGMVTAIRDVTERKRVERELYTEKQRFQDLIESAPFGMVIIDKDGTFRYLNLKFKQLFGYELSDIPNGKEWFRKAYPDPEYRRNVISAWVEDLKDSRSRERRSRTFTVTCKDGTRKIIHFIPVQLEKGEDLMACEDVTEVVLAEGLLRNSEERYRTLFQESKDTIFITAPDGRFIDINPAGVELLGYASKEELLKIDIARDLYAHIEDKEKFVKLLMEQGFVKDYEMVLKRKDGERLIVLTTATLVRHDNGRVAAYRGIVRDVTEQKKLEQQLLQSQKMEAIGLLAGGIAHDFNNLLMVIMGNTELGLMNTELSQPHYEIFSKIQEGVKKASNLIQQLLAFSRRQMLQPKVLNVTELIGNLSRMLSRLIGEDIELKIEFDPNLGNVYADPGSLEQVIMNLTLNAREAMPQGGILRIEVQNVLLDEAFCRPYPYMTPGEYVQISVIDSGKGMDESMLQRIFEPFFTTRKEGTGLGLAVVYGIVKQHKGHINVSSQLGQGSRFDIYFPIYKDLVLQEALEVLEKTIPRGKETILIAEDEKEVRVLFKAFLEGLGYQVFLACDGEEALEIFSSHRNQIDLVILDGVMPKISGPEVYERIHALSPNFPCLFLTGYSEEIVQRYFNQELKTPMLRKPITFQELGEKVREVLDQAGRPSK